MPIQHLTGDATALALFATACFITRTQTVFNMLLCLMDWDCLKSSISMIFTHSTRAGFYQALQLVPLICFVLCVFTNFC
jgi:hypothetical protein